VKSTSPHTQTQKLSIGFQLRDMVESALGVVDEKGNKFRMDLSQGSSLSSTLAFLKRSLSKGAKPWVYSQKPKTVKKLQKKSASKVLIGKTFKKVVLDKTKHCFVSLCPLAEDDCKHHFPTWNELATLLKKGGVDDVVVARVDPIHNDMAAGFSAKPMDGAPFGSIYPTIYFVAKDKKDDEERLNWRAKIDDRGHIEEENAQAWIKYMLENGAKDSLSAGYGNEAPMIPDPKAVKPADWDDDDDGVWEAQMIKNPASTGKWDPAKQLAANKAKAAAAGKQEL